MTVGAGSRRAVGAVGVGDGDGEGDGLIGNPSKVARREVMATVCSLITHFVRISRANPVVSRPAPRPAAPVLIGHSPRRACA